MGRSQHRVSQGEGVKGLILSIDVKWEYQCHAVWQQLRYYIHNTSRMICMHRSMGIPASHGCFTASENPGMTELGGRDVEKKISDKKYDQYNISPTLIQPRQGSNSLRAPSLDKMGKSRCHNNHLRRGSLSVYSLLRSKPFVYPLTASFQK